MKERLGIIVRAKEGKMVNINAPLPFNLNNHNNGNHHHNQSRPNRFHTRSPQPSVDTERQSVLSSASASASQELDEEMRWPAPLNVRIVRGGSALARGRPVMRDIDGDGVPLSDSGAEGGATDGAGVGEGGGGRAGMEQPAEARSGSVRRINNDE
ncbi:hypothetical protein B0F90DRAFT_363088 [Multifurca ochricompacta]|uniref:Uncharacterized protein n=1 Tax=Multifurca ochricompacta TaxID=376703 RepID=A0AAD4LXH5_9AGAM|nr:hypothetical protein B0F90DRAFT_363088 [Multifurca ochricompacta]